MSFTEVFLSLVPFIRRAAIVVVEVEKQSKVNGMEEAKNVSFLLLTFWRKIRKRRKIIIRKVDQFSESEHTKRFGRSAREDI